MIAGARIRQSTQPGFLPPLISQIKGGISNVTVKKSHYISVVCMGIENYISFVLFNCAVLKFVN